jgi:2-phosphosulfolactate phosphatase
LGGEPSPEARTAIAAARAVTLDDVRACPSARELIDAGFADDVDLAVQQDVSTAVPLLRDGAFRDAAGM